MLITKHGMMRFKERQNIKNQKEMKRRTEHAVNKGKLLENESTDPKTMCYLFDGFCYILAGKNRRLVTVYKQNKSCHKNKKTMLDDLKIKEFNRELRYSSMCC